MSVPFVDHYAPDDMPNWPVSATPRFFTRIVQTKDGHEQVSRRWKHPLFTFTMPDVPREQSTYEAVSSQWFAMRGPANCWPWRNPLDFMSAPMIKPNDEFSDVSFIDQVIGYGDGTTTQFQMYKNYARFQALYRRPIRLPVLDTIVVGLSGNILSPSGYSVTRPGGVITFTSAPGPGVVISAGYHFDHAVRFETDDIFEGMVNSWAASGYATLSLIEERGF